jgi:ACS family hexuronate transporter-like MFS transporter
MTRIDRPTVPSTERTRTTVRFRIAALGFAAALINYGDRAAISVSAPFILEEFDFSPVTWGIILSAFFWTYSPFAFFGGIMADRLGVKRGYTIAMLVWSISLPITATAWSFGAFLVARLLFGIGEGPQAAISTKTASMWFPRAKTATVLNLMQAGTTIGPIIATPVVVWISLTLGWREAFWILACLGIVWIALWWFVADDSPDKHKGVNTGELAYITADHQVAAESNADDSPTTSAHVGLWTFVRTPFVAALAFAFFCYSWVLFMFLTWYPTYLVSERGVSKTDLAAVATVPWVTATIGLVGGGILADWFVRSNGGALIKARRPFIVVGLLGSGLCFAPSAFVASPTLGLALVCAATMLLLGSYQYQSIIVAIAPQSLTGHLAGFIQMCSTVAGILAPIVTGAIVEATGSFVSAFFVGGAFAILGALAVAVLVRPRFLPQGASEFARLAG